MNQTLTQLLKHADSSKPEVEKEVIAYFEGLGFSVVDKDFAKPWGGYLVFSEEQAPKFVTTFFSDIPFAPDELKLKLSPKVLVVAPHLRASWQYHDRRSELHRILFGPIPYAVSPTDDQPEPKIYNTGDLLRLPQGTRHRYGGGDCWGVIAEIWQHVDPQNPSEEADNHRLEDDFNRT